MTTLENYLNEKGLDGKRWSEIFQNKLGIKQVKDLKILKPIHFSKIQQEINPDNLIEEMEIKKLFKISDEEESQNDVDPKKKEIKENLEALLKKLREKNLNNEKQLDERLADELKKHSFPGELINRLNIDEIMNRLENKVKEIEIESFSEANDITLEKLFKIAKGGKALKGVYLKADQWEFKDTIIETPVNLFWKKPETEWVNDFKEILKKKDVTKWDKAVNKFNIGVALELFGFVGGGILMGGGEFNLKKENEVENLDSEEELHYLKIIYRIIPINQIDLSLDDIVLTKHILEEVRNIQNVIFKIENTDSEKLVLKFFDKYGSHVNLGPFIFGGIYLMVISKDIIDKKEINDCRKASAWLANGHFGGLSLGVGGGIDIGMNNINVQLDKTKIDEILDKTNITYKKEGGLEVTNYNLWQKDIIKNVANRTIISCGKKLIPIWEILYRNHEINFELCNFIKSIWEKKTDKTSDVFLPNKTEVYGFAKHILSKIEEINSKDDSNFDKYFSFIVEEMIKYKLDVSLKSKDKSFWTLFIKHDSIENLFKRVLTRKPNLDFWDMAKFFILCSKYIDKSREIIIFKKELQTQYNALQEKSWEEVLIDKDLALCLLCSQLTENSFEYDCCSNIVCSKCKNRMCPFCSVEYEPKTIKISM